MVAGSSLRFVAFAASGDPVEVDWSVLESAGGSIDPEGQYTAPFEAGTFTIQATTTGSVSSVATARVTVVEDDQPAPVVVSIDPANGRVSVRGSLQLHATVRGAEDTRVEWSVLEAEGGAIDESGTYTAPAATGSFTVRATSVADPIASTEARVEVVEGVAITISPQNPMVEVSQHQLFEALISGTDDQAVVWSVVEAEGGTITEEGAYTAPASEGIFHVVATSVADPSSSASTAIDVRAPGEVRIEPGEASVEAGDHLTFHATVTGSTDQRVAWSVVEPGGGSINAAGTYTAPSIQGTFHVMATSTADSRRSSTATIFVSERAPSDVSILPADRRTEWNPGIPGGIPRDRNTFTTLSSLVGDGEGDSSAMIQQAIDAAGAAYQSSGVIQEIVLPAGTFRFTNTISLNRSGVVLRGQGTTTRLRYDGDENAPAFALGRERWGDYSAMRGPWALVADGIKGSKQITISASDAANIQPGDILGIDEEDDPSFVRLGDGWYGKRQANADTHGPALRGAGLYRSVGTMILVTDKVVAGGDATITLADPMHMGFRTSNHAQIFHISTPRSGFGEVQLSGLESLYLTGGTISTNNVSYCWIDGLEVDGNPGTPNIGSYTQPGGISGHSIELFHAYRCEVRGSYIHHSRHIGQGGGSYLVTLSGYTSESLIEDNIIVFGNKPVVGNMMGGGNVIAYNYVDNARTDSATWQEGAIDLNHLSFSHNALVEGNWTANMGADTTHGNSGWHVFHRNFATGQNSAPVYGSYPYTSGAPDSSFRRAVGVDGYTRETTFIGNVLHAGTGAGVYQVDHSAGPRLDEAAVWRIGGGVDGGGDNLDDGTTLSLLYRHGNWDSVTNGVVWDSTNTNHTLPDSLYLTSKPAFFGSHPWPWVNPLGQTAGERVGTLPAKARYDAIREDR